MKRSWTNIKVLEPKILSMRAAGKTRSETAYELGLNKSKIKTGLTDTTRKQNVKKQDFDQRDVGVNLP